MSESTLVLASNNAGKLKEFQQLFAAQAITVKPQSAWQVPEVDEPHPTFIENALAKARHASQRTGLPALADDSGLCMQALQGAPGVYSARYATLFGQPKSDDENNRQLVRVLAAHADKRGYYYCVLVLVRSPDDPIPLIAEGRWYGELIDQPRGEHGFGYDPFFFLPELGLTAAELDPAEKNRRSHRALAMQALLKKWPA